MIVELTLVVMSITALIMLFEETQLNNEGTPGLKIETLGDFTLSFMIYFFLSPFALIIIAVMEVVKQYENSMVFKKNKH